MGALTLKSPSFEFRGWDIEGFDSFDPTDGFGSNTRVYISKNQTVLIEPDYNTSTSNTWLSDKGRQFFDGMFNSKVYKFEASKTNFWPHVIKSITENIYIVDHCNSQRCNKRFLVIVFENLGLEVLNILNMLSQSYSFIKLKRAEKTNLENDNESLFQLNVASNSDKLNYTSMCLLIANNPRCEGYCLNLNLRQRFFKGNFKCLNVGSLLNLTFPISFLGSNINVLKSLTEGNSIICQDFGAGENFLVVYSNELLKRNDGSSIVQMMKVLSYLSVFNKTWDGLNMLSASLSENGNHLYGKSAPLTTNDLNSCSLLYFINVNYSNNANLRVISELNILNYSNNKILEKNLVLDQNYKMNNNYSFYEKMVFKKTSCAYVHVPTNVFYENEDTFINTEGFFKRTTKLISKKKARNNWQIIRKLIGQLKTSITSLDKKNGAIVFFNSKKGIDFKNYTNLQYYATRNLTNLSYNLATKTAATKRNGLKLVSFRGSTRKIQVTKLKYWLDDFFINGKDEYSRNSKILTNCSKILRNESTNFF